MPYQSWSHRHPPFCLFISSHVFITRPSTILPSNCLSVRLFIYSRTYHPSIHPSTALLSFHHTSTIDSSIHHLTITIHPSTIVHPPFIYLLIHPSTHHSPILPLSTHPSAILLSICCPSTHPSIHHPSMRPCIPPFLHSSAHCPFSYHSFIYSFTRSSRDLP